MLRFLSIGFVVMFTIGAQATEAAHVGKSCAIASAPICSSALAERAQATPMTKTQIAFSCRCCGWTTEQGIDGKSHRVCIHQCCD